MYAHTETYEQHQRTVATSHLRGNEPLPPTVKQKRYAYQLCKRAGLKVTSRQIASMDSQQISRVIREAQNLLTEQLLTEISPPATLNELAARLDRSTS